MLGRLPASGTAKKQLQASASARCILLTKSKHTIGDMNIKLGCKIELFKSLASYLHLGFSLF